MKNIIAILLSAACSVISLSVWADPQVSQKAVFFNVEEFNLKYDSGSFNCTIVAYYYREENRVEVSIRKLTDEDSTVMVSMHLPLDYNYFREEFFRNLLAKKSQMKLISNESIMKVYNFVYALTIPADYDLIPIGYLKFRNWVQRIDKNNDQRNSLERERRLDSLSGRFSGYTVYVNSLKQNIINNILKVDSIAANTLNKITLQIDSLTKEKGKFNDDSSKLSEFNIALENLTEKLVSYSIAVESYKVHNNTLIWKLQDGVILYPGAIDPDSGKESGPFYKNFSSNYDNIQRQINTYNNELANYNAVTRELASKYIYEVQKVSLHFERGFLERVQVWVNNGYGTDIFENIYAIGISSVKNFKIFYDTKLIIRKSLSGNSQYIYLSDVISDYDNFLDLYTRDYSPGDTTINFLYPSQTPFILLRKERLVNLFDSRIYTDLAGLRENDPNGILQIEISKRFNILTQRYQTKNFRSDLGYLNYLNISGNLSKIESDQKYLALRNQNVVLNGEIISPNYATTLDFRRYENFSLRMDANIFLFDWPDAKFTIYFDLGLRYGHTPLYDSVRTVNNGFAAADPTKAPLILEANTFGIEPKLKLEIFAEKRISADFSYQVDHSWMFSNNQFKQVASYQKSDLNTLLIDPKARWYNIYELNVKVETSDNGNGRTFLRARFFQQWGDGNTFFPQIQVGYAYNLFLKK